MKTDSRWSRRRERSARLLAEAKNCVATAMMVRGRADAAALLDEAIRLAKRSRELCENDARRRTTAPDIG